MALLEQNNIRCSIDQMQHRSEHNNGIWYMASQWRACNIEAEELETDIPPVISSEAPASPHTLENRFVAFSSI
jgi:hypothetical protein